MNEVYINKNNLKDYEIKMLDRVGFKTKDLISIDDLLITIDELLYELDEKDDEIEHLKHPEDDFRETFDYSEWKANQE